MQTAGIAGFKGFLHKLGAGAALGRVATPLTPRYQDRSSELLQTTLENMDHGCLVIAGDLKILGANRRAAEILNVPAELLSVGRSFADVIARAARRGDYGPGDVEELTKQKLASAVSRDAHSFDRHQPDGTVLSARAQPLPRGGMVVTYTDITELRRLEKKLRNSEQRYALAIEGAGVGIWDWDIANEKVALSPRYADILGIERSEIGNSAYWWQQFIHPRDIVSFREGIREHLRGKSDSYEAEYRVRTATGAFRWIEDRGAALRDESGRAYRMAGSVVDITAKKEAERALEKMATTDSLTGASNRRKFMDSASVELYRAQRYGNQLSVAMFDLDHFKKINDNFGHAAGDKCLCAFVDLIFSVVRQSDILARYGGEEFVLLMPHTTVASARQLAERIREGVEQLSPRLSKSEMSFTVSAGIAGYEQGDSLETLLARADEALYLAKERGRNRTIIHGLSRPGVSMDGTTG